MLALIVASDAGPYYFKLVGPRATVTRWEEAYETLVATIAPGPTGASADVEHP